MAIRKRKSQMVASPTQIAALYAARAARLAAAAKTA